MKFLIVIFSLLFLTNTLLADDTPSDRIYIKVGEANIKKSLLAFPSLLFVSPTSTSPNYKQVGADLFNTITNDLEVSNLFTTIKQSAYLEDPAKTGLTPAPGNPGGFHFDAWTKIGADFLIRGSYKLTGNGDLEFEVYVYYVPQAKLILGKKYDGKAKEARVTAHTFSDDLMKALTGKRGVFRTKLVSASDKAGNRWKEIYVMDWDGRNQIQVTNHHSISLSPTWAPNGKSIAYTSFAYHPALRSRNPDLFTYDIFSGKRFLVSSRTGINSGSAFSPDGQSIFLTISHGSDPDIYKMNLDGEDLHKITNGPHGSLNVEPNISPDGTKVAFSSDRSGAPMVYVMNTDGTNVKRITFAGKYNSSPSFSPDGKKIVFAGQDHDHFDLFTVNTDGSDLQRLTTAKTPTGHAANNEDPSFSPDGRLIVFTSNRSGKNQIYLITVDGTSERRITVDNHNYFKPKWSPYID